jgi:signal peptidase I
MKKSIAEFVRRNKGFAIFIVLMVVFRSSLADWNTVPSGSMQPTIVEGDRLFVNKLAYDLNFPLTHASLHRFAEPQRSDVIVFDSVAAKTRLVKRVIGLPGDVVALVGNRLTINGVAASYAVLEQSTNGIVALETYAGLSHRVKFSAHGTSPYSTFGPVTVPQGHYLVMGDNRDNSADSRVIGFVPREEIAGKTESVVMSLNYDNYYIPRKDRFFHRL